MVPFYDFRRTASAVREGSDTEEHTSNGPGPSASASTLHSASASHSESSQATLSETSNAKPSGEKPIADSIHSNAKLGETHPTNTAQPNDCLNTFSGQKSGSNKRRNKKRSVENTQLSQMESAFFEMVEIHKKAREDFDKQVVEPTSEKTPQQYFFDLCAMRMAKLNGETQSFLQFQINQLFFNAENPTQPPVPITRLPVHQPVTTVLNPNQYPTSVTDTDFMSEALRMSVDMRD